MFFNYIKVAIRNLSRNKVYSIVNISGLVIGLTCSILVIIYILQEMSYDQFHKNADNVYRLGKELVTSDNVIREPLSSGPAAITLADEFPEIASVVRFGSMGRMIVRYQDNQFYEGHIRFVDPSVFDIFTFPMITGDPETALLKPYSVVLTEETAMKYFGEEDPIGKVLKFNNQLDYAVTGVMKNIPDNSHFEFNMLCSMETLAAQKQSSLQNWLSFDFMTYILLNDNIAPETLEQKFPAFIKKHIGNSVKSRGESLHFFLHPLKKIQLYSHLEGYAPGRITQVYFFITFAVSILLIACINFMNLSTARSISRAKEVGIRKTLGAGRLKLIYQFLAEALVLSFISLGIAMILVKLLLPVFSTLIRQKLTLNLIQTPWLIICFFALPVLVGIISGSYPALYLSRFQPIRIFKDKFITTTGKARFRSSLVVFQFFTATVFIFQQFTFGIQLKNLRNLNLGFNKKNVVVLPIMDEEIRQSIPLLKKEVGNQPGIEHVSATSILPGYYIPRTLKIPQGYTTEEMQLMDDINVDHDFITTLGIEMADGRNFSETFSTDQNDAIIINETAAEKFGWKNPIGKRIEYSIGPDQYATGTVCGVVKDFHLATPHRVIDPLFISNHPDQLSHVLIRIQPEQMQKTLGHIEETWKELFPNHPFNYSFLEQSYDRYIQVVEKVLKVFFYFTFLMIFIACLGIFALATYTAESRTKEIGIRKVMGATTYSIIFTLNRNIIKLVSISIIFAWLFLQIPILDPHMFLAYFVDAHFTVYLKTACLILFIALGTISYQAVRAATANPVEALRYE